MAWARFQASRWGSGMDAARRGQTDELADRLRMEELTLDAFDLVGAEPGEGSLVLGSRDACRTNRALNVNEGSAGRGTTLSNGHRLLFGRHGLVFFGHCQRSCSQYYLALCWLQSLRKAGRRVPAEDGCSRQFGSSRCKSKWGEVEAGQGDRWDGGAARGSLTC